MPNSYDTDYPVDSQHVTGPYETENPSPASREEQVSHFYARHAALDRGERLSWSDERRHPWPKKDRINWIGHRQAELETEISKCRKEREKKSLEQTREDYNTWMLKERDGQSWSKIAQSRIEQMGIPKQQSYGVSEAFKAQARRAWDRVERSHPGSSLYKPVPLDLENSCPHCGYPWL